MRQRTGLCTWTKLAASAVILTALTAMGLPQAFAADAPPGLYNDNGTPHAVHTPSPVTGRTLNVVTEYGANTADNSTDDAANIRAALAAANPGDELYLPNGVYNLNSNDPNGSSTHFLLKSGVHIRGESETGVILKSNYDNTPSRSYVIRGVGVHDVQLSNFTVTSVWNGSYSSDPTTNNPSAGGPDYGIQIIYDSSQSQASYNVTLDRLTFEKFKSNAVKITKSQDVVVQNCTFKNATDLGGGGSGYGIVFEGTYQQDRIGQADDSARNVAQNNTIVGPYIRHGILLQLNTHNNVIRNNTLSGTAYDAIDLHGEDEYLNEVYGNTISASTREGGIGLGNSGGTTYVHDATGRKNSIHDNTITGSKYGIRILYDTPDTLIERNTIKDSTVSSAAGIYLGNAPGTIMRKNSITNLTGSGAWGIVLAGDSGTGTSPAGNPDHSQLLNNTITGNANGLKITAGTGIGLGNNTVSGNLNANTSISVTTTALAADTSSPAAPTGLASPSKTQNRASLTWNAVGDASVNGYLIYNGSALVGTTAGETSFEVVNLQPATAYTFTVKAKDAGGNVSAASSPISVTTAGSAGTSMLSDDFESYTSFPAGSWTNASGNGTWSIVTDGSKVTSQSATGNTFIVTGGNVAWNNYTYSAKVKVGATNVRNGIVGRYVDSNNYYWLVLYNGNVLLNKKVGGTTSTLQTAAFAASTSTFYNLKLEISGTSIKGYVNGALMVQGTDSSLTAGKVGLYANGVAEYDDVLVTQ